MEGDGETREDGAAREAGTEGAEETIGRSGSLLPIGVVVAKVLEQVRRLRRTALTESRR
jgi:hypothetical protein